MHESPFFTLPPKLAVIQALTVELGFSMGSERGTGNLLQVLAASKPGGRFLELGTGTGIATAWILSGMDETSTLISIDTDPNVQTIAREILGSDPRLTLLTGDAEVWLGNRAALLPPLQKAPPKQEVESEKEPKEKFDLIFADAMPGKFTALNHALNLVAPCGFYVIDDLLPQPNWPEGHGEKIPPLLYTLSSDPRFVSLPMAWASGIMVLVRLPPQPKPNPHLFLGPQPKPR
jgi:predicted O-methyltransferase YrrM